MIYTFLKIAAYAITWISPIVILVGISQFMHSRSVRTAKQRMVRTLLVPVVWCIGLLGALMGHAAHESAWRIAHPNGIASEENMLALGDYPNVLAGWVLLGWIPVVAGLVLSVRRHRNPHGAEQGTAE